MTDKMRFRARMLDLRSYDELTREMIRIEADKGGVPLMAPKAILRNILLEQIPTKAANIMKQEVLVRGGELATPWTAADFAADKVDCILTGSLVTLRSTVSKLYRQTVYHLPEIADAIQDVLLKTTPGYLPVAREARRQGVVVEETLDDLHGGRIPLGQGNRARGGSTLAAPYGRPDYRWEFGARTYVMGVLNLTPDSFSDDGLDRNLDAAVARGCRMAADGADVIDVGGESSEARDHSPIAVAEEIDRVVPVIRRLRQALPDMLLSVDTWKAPVAAAALAAGANLINDVGAMRRDPEMRDVAAQFRAPIVVMHSQEGTRYQDLMSDLARFFWTVLDEAAGAGVAAGQVLLDAGFGFGKSVHQDLECTRRLRELTSFGRPLLHAPSRKRSIGRVLGYPDTVAERLFGTAAALTVGIAGGADLVRVHDVLDMKRCVQMSDALLRGYKGPDE